MAHIIAKKDSRIWIDGKKSNFYVHEFVCPEDYARWGYGAIRCISASVILATQFLRTESGLSTTINNYEFGGPYKDSGRRSMQSYIRMYNASVAAEKYIKTYSLHKDGKAGDLKITDMTSFQMVDMLLHHEDKVMKFGITRYENPEYTKGRNRGWMHIDDALTGLKELQMVDP